MSSYSLKQDQRCRVLAAVSAGVRGRLRHGFAVGGLKHLERRAAEAHVRAAQSVLA